MDFLVRCKVIKIKRKKKRLHDSELLSVTHKTNLHKSLKFHKKVLLIFLFLLRGKFIQFSQARVYMPRKKKL